MLTRHVHLAVLSATLSALASVGCGGGGGGGVPRGGSASATFGLSIYDVGYPNTALRCDAIAGNDVAVFLNGSKVDYGAANCVGSFFTLTTDAVPAGDYTVDFYLYGTQAVYGNTETIIGSARANERLLSGYTDFSATVQPIWVQSFVASWDIVNRANLPVKCAAGETVQLEFERPGSNAWIVSAFPCQTGSGASYPIPIDYTSADWGLYLMSGATTEDSIVSQQPVAIPDNADVSIAPQTFIVSQ